MTRDHNHHREAAVPLVRGSRDALPLDLVRLARLEATLLDCFEQAGYDRLATPVLESVDLHERKSGAGIVGKLFVLAGAAPRTCLRPELTAGVVRAYTAAEPAPALPWRVSHSGAVFRHENATRTDRLREFHQVGLERLGDSGPFADAEVIWLAVAALGAVGLPDPTIRVGHVGLILEILARSGLPNSAQSALIEMLSEAASDHGDAGAIERGLDHFEGWLRQALDGPSSGRDADDLSDDAGIDRLFRTLVPVVTGRRSGAQIVSRLRLKWDLGHGLLDTLARVRQQVQALANLQGPPNVVLDRLSRDFAAYAPESVVALRTLVDSLGDHGVDSSRVRLDLGLGRGIGFYSQMIFDLSAQTTDGPIELGGGGRYDGLARVLGSDRDDRGVGFAFGLERIDGVLQARRGNRPAATEGRLTRAILVIPATLEATPAAVRCAAELRGVGGRAILESGWRSPDLASRAAALNARWSVVVGTARGVSAVTTATLYDHQVASSQPTTSNVAEVTRIVAQSLREGNR